MLHKKGLHQLLRLILVVVAVICICLILKYTVLYLYPFLLAVLLAFLINPFVTLLEQKLKLPRFLATITVLSAVFIFIIGIIILITAELIQGTTYLAENIPAYFRIFVAFAEDFLNTTVLPSYHKLTSIFHTLNPAGQETINTQLKQLADHIASSGATLLHNLLLKIPHLLSLLPSSMTVILFTVLATILITKDWHLLNQSIKKIIPSSANASGKKVWDHLKRTLFGFIKAQLILISITAVIIYIGLLVLNVEHAITIAVLAAVVDLLPFFGTGIIFIPWILYLFFAADYSLTICITVLYMVVIVQRQLSEPKIVSSNIGLHPLATLFALFIGLQVWGFLGLLIAPILLVIVTAFYQAGVFNQLWIFIKG